MGSGCRLKWNTGNLSGWVVGFKLIEMEASSGRLVEDNRTMGFNPSSRCTRSFPPPKIN
jgi:hypothetical protein